MSEFITEVDRNNKVIGARPREDFYSGNHIHRGVHALLLNTKNQLLISHRAKSKRWDPDLDDYSASGTVGNETEQACLIREVREELGIPVTNPRLLCTFYHQQPDDRAFHTIFVVRSEAEPVIQPEEVASTRWVDLNELKKEVAENPERFTKVFLKGLAVFFSKRERSPSF